MSNGRDERPNFLLLLPDQHRFDWLSTTPHLELETPVLDRLRAAGVRFRHAVCPAPVCAPSRACLALGMDYDRCGVPSNQVDLPLGRPTYYQRLRDAGYHVAGVGKFDLHKATRDWGLDGSRLLPEWGFSQGIDSEGKWDAIHSGALESKGPYMAYLHRQGLADVHCRAAALRARWPSTRRCGATTRRWWRTSTGSAGACSTSWPSGVSWHARW